MMQTEASMIEAGESTPEGLVLITMLNPRNQYPHNYVMFDKTGHRINYRKGYHSRQTWLTIRVKPSRIITHNDKYHTILFRGVQHVITPEWLMNHCSHCGSPMPDGICEIREEGGPFKESGWQRFKTCPRCREETLIYQWPQHVLLTPKTCPCDKTADAFCPVCEMGLGICARCHAAEIELDERPCVWEANGNHG